MRDFVECETVVSVERLGEWERSIPDIKSATWASFLHLYY